MSIVSFLRENIKSDKGEKSVFMAAILQERNNRKISLSEINFTFMLKCFIFGL